MRGAELVDLLGLLKTHSCWYSFPPFQRRVETDKFRFTLY